MRLAVPVAAVAALALLGGCASNTSPTAPPTGTRISERGVVLPAEIRGDALVVAAKGAHGALYHFLVDTGSSRTLVSPDLAQALAAKGPPPHPAQVEVRAADGTTTLLPAAVLGRLSLGGARFEYVPALVYDCSTLSDELGERIDGVLGFSLFRDTVLTLDYPHSRVLITGPRPEPVDGSSAVLPTNPGSNIPVVTLKIAGRPIYAIIDSGKDVPLSLNRVVARRSDFAFGPIPGTMVHDLRGDRQQRIGRLAVDLTIGQYVVPRPIAELTEDLSTIGGGILRFFSVTFDQPNGEVRFYRNAADPIAIPAERGTGLGFSRTPAYWRVVGVMPGSPAEKMGISPGDLVTKINGEPVAQWDKPRYDALQAGAAQVRLSFLAGTSQYEKTVPIVELVP
ncbi:MAG TPA: aspartyl protease family protein [Opitutaceae bacterium]|nr:aspartyl protease family protein [Opitutaceae bacterium]